MKVSEKKLDLVDVILLDIKNNPSTWEDYTLQILEEHLKKQSLQTLKDIYGISEID